MLRIQFHSVVQTHLDIDTTEFKHGELTKMQRPPSELLEKYQVGDLLDAEDLKTFDYVEMHTGCFKPHTNHSSDPFEQRAVRCEWIYYFAATARLIQPRYNKMELHFDEVSQVHDGYCSDADCEVQINDNCKTKIMDLPEEWLGLYEEDGEIPVTDVLIRKYMWMDYHPNDIFGSGYCYKARSEDSRLEYVNTCNTLYYILSRIELV